jgi:hypothetical protein
VHPSKPTLFVTGYADHRAVRGVSENQIIGKSFRLEELANKVRAALAERRGQSARAVAAPLDPPSPMP